MSRPIFGAQGIYPELHPDLFLLPSSKLLLNYPLYETQDIIQGVKNEL